MYKILIASLFLLYSCGSSESSPKVATDAGSYDDKIMFPFNLPKAKEGDDMKVIRSKMKDIIEERQQKVKGDLFDITYYYISPHGFANLRKRTGPQAFVGQWMKFETDYTYTYGVYDKVIGSGIYHYTDQDFFLMLLDDDSHIEPRLFSLQSNSEFFNFIGRPIMFADDGTGENLLLGNWANDAFLASIKVNIKVENGMQIMMKMMDEKPVKPVSPEQ